jgi:hypothetical protein
MAYNSHHSAGYTDGLAGNNSIDASSETFSWADIEKPLDSSSLTGSNYGRGSRARSETAPSTELATPAQKLAEASFATGFGLVQAGASPFRGLDGDFFSDSAKRIQPTDTAPALAEPKIGTSHKLNPTLVRTLGNLQRRESAGAVEITSVQTLTPESTQAPQAKLEIGLAIPPGADTPHQKGRVARAVVRLEPAVEAAAAADVETQRVEATTAVAERRIANLDATPPVAEVRGNPLENPYKYVGDQHAAIKEKFDGNNVKYGRTTLLPDGRVVQVQTASDNTTLTETKGEQGANSMVVHDRYRRPVTEQHTGSDGTWSFSNLTYNDSNGIKPFCSEKLTVNSDGSVVKLRFSTMGQIQSRETYP